MIETDYYRVVIVLLIISSYWIAILAIRKNDERQQLEFKQLVADVNVWPAIEDWEAAQKSFPEIEVTKPKVVSEPVNEPGDGSRWEEL